ncbi:MAG: ABC transporter permease, partial [Gammaproteobacteria bacterium]
AGVAIAAATRRYSERHFDATAVLRCLGCKKRDILLLYAGQFLVLGSVGSLIGCLFGWLTQEALFQLLRNLLPQQVAEPGLGAVVFGFGTGMAILAGFAFPPLLRLQRVSPLRVLRRDLEPLPTGAWLVYGLAAAIIGLLVWRYTEDFKMTATILGTGAVALLVLALLVYGLLKMLASALPRLSMTWRFAVQGLTRNPGASVAQIVAFSVTLVAMVLSFTVRNDLLDNWHKQLPDKAPNYFVLNVFPEQYRDFNRAIHDNGIEASLFYPIVRGRLIRINEQPVRQIVSKDSQGERATHRDLSLTWSKELPADNVVTDGEWWSGDKPGQVSVEQKLAESLKVEVGDVLTFSVGSQSFDAVVTSIRSLHWDTMKPNFYMIFSPGTLDGFAYTFLASLYLPETEKHFINTWVKKFPGITVLEVDTILKQFKAILTQLTEAIDYLLYFALAAGFTVLFSAVLSSLDRRIQEGALMRTLGARRGFLRKTHVIEFSLLGFTAGLLAAALSEILLFALYRHLLHFPYAPDPRLWLSLPAVGALAVGAAGYWGVRHVADKPPLALLRDA